ncbi:MAG: DUF3179 domain-containing protein [Acidimicrobiales bacterium]|nr:DUF3179 domain-containing protein [Acidimicrobiales bacterium]
MRRNRIVALAAALAIVAGACASGGSGDGESVDGGSETTSMTVTQVTSSPSEDVPSALDDRIDPSFPEPLVDPSEVVSGGPPPDGIPPIDEPRFLDVDDVDFLEDDEPVLFLELEGEARAYPMQVMIWHEIVNDTVADVPVTVSYCPLCNTAVAYDRRLDDRVLDFGTSGLLFNSALVMYDRQTETLWSHFTGEAVIGHLTGAQLGLFPVATVSWADFRASHPDGLVLSRDTGADRDYGRNPYPGYDDVDTAPFMFDGEVDGRLAAKERVLGIDRADDPVAVRLDALADAGVIDLDVAGEPVVVWVESGTASALDAGTVADGRDVGATGAFVPVVDGRRLDFTRTDDGFVDDETGSRWDVLGRAVDGPLEGEQLDAVVHVDTFWFAWGAFQPDTRIVE